MGALFSALNLRLQKGTFARNVLILSAGTAVAQAITILASPILTRLYSPAAFGVYALFLAVTAIAGSVAAGKYESAIILPEADADGFSLTALACSISLAVSLLLLFIILVMREPVARWLGTERDTSWLYWIPPMTFLSGSYGALNYWYNRRKQFGRLSCNRILRNAVSSGTNVAMGKVGAGPTGLIYGSLLGQACATGFFALQVWREERPPRSALALRAQYRQAIRYRNFPRYLVPSGLVELSAGQVPIILFSSLFGTTALGYFSFAMRLISIPMGLLAESIRDVFRQKASVDFVKHGTCQNIFRKTLRKLVLLSIPPFVIILFFGPFLFTLVFGEHWRNAGVHAQMMAPMFLLRFITSPLSSTFYIAEKQKWDLILQAILFSAIMISLVTVASYTRNPEAAIFAYTAVYCLKYIIEFTLSYRFSLGTTGSAFRV